MSFMSGIEQAPRETFAHFAFPDASEQPSQRNSKECRQDVPRPLTVTQIMLPPVQTGYVYKRIIPDGNNSICPFCGYKHKTTSKIGCVSSSANEDRPGKDGDGDRSTGTAKGNGSGKHCGGDKKGPDKGKGSSSDHGNDIGYMNGNDRRVCPDPVTNSLVIGVIVLFVVGTFSTVICTGKESFLECIHLGSSPDCAVSDNILNFLDKAGTKGAEAESGGGNLGTYQQLDVPAHLDERLAELKKAIRNKKYCLKPYGWVGSSCEVGLVDYAAAMAGGSIQSTGNTEEVPRPMACRCMDSKFSKRICIPGEGECSSCVCDSIHADTLITGGAVIPGICWAFRGVGELEIRLFNPLIIVAVTIHHPAKSILPPGYFKSAPKDIELWGISDELDKEPYHFGAFQYTEDGGSTQIFEVPKPSATFYPRVKFNFPTNHGNPNYTAVYKLEVHGLTAT